MKSMPMVRVVVVILFCLGAPCSAGTVLRVDDDAPPGGDGSSWESVSVGENDLCVFTVIDGTTSRPAPWSRSRKPVASPMMLGL